MTESQDIIAKLKDAQLVGCGGACFPTWMKWRAVKQQAGDKKVYVIANGSEGEPYVFKDEYVLKHHSEEFIEGIKIALKTFPNAEAIIYLNHDYYDRYKESLEKLSQGFPITYFRKTARYIAGEETALISHIEGKRDEPRSKPPYPAESGLYNYPTLINNIETFYRVYQIHNDTYSHKIFFSISGDVKNKGVFEFREYDTVKNILIETDNWPTSDFFVQIGGGASGAIFLPDELNIPKCGAASIVVFDKEKTDVFKLMEFWATFFAQENCDKCTPCREGSMRILEMTKNNNIDYKKMDNIFLSLEKTSFCPLGRSMATPYRTLISKVIKNG
ncbi:MAG: NADH-ubiquinone oxidoreductase-F iron-sulfur binding region domain-containing protein [bacterium]